MQPSIKTIETASGSEVFIVAESERPNLVLMDIRMPGMNGIEATRRTKTAQPSTKLAILTMLDDTFFITRGEMSRNQSTLNFKSPLYLVPLIAHVYFLLGAAGLMLAIPPGYASPVFPAAGFALACILLFDFRRALTGIWLGSFSLNMLNIWYIGRLSPAIIAVNAAIATGAAIQGWIGGLLVKSMQKSAWHDLEKEQDIFRFLLLGGILSTVISPSFGTATMYVAGIIEKSEILFNWWNWYVGDAFGILVFTPLTFCLFNRSSTLWSERRKLIIVPMLFTLCLVCLVFYGASRWEKQTLYNQLQSDGQIIADRINERLISHREVLSSLCHFIEATPNFSFQKFKQFTMVTLQDNPDIFALSFNDLISHEKRSEYEKMMSTLSPLGPFQITERDSHKDLVRAADRPEYVTVRYIVPLLNNQQAVGYDINSEPIRQDAIKRALALNGMAVTAPIHLVQEQKNRVGLLELLPVQTGAEGHAADGIGFAVAVLKIDETIEIATRGHVPDGLVFQLLDPQAPESKGILFNSSLQGSGSITTSRIGQWKTGLRLGDRDWVLTIHTNANYQRQHRPWTAWAIGVVGLMFTTLFQVLLFGITGRTSEILRKNNEIENMAKTLEEKVIQRTAELRESMESYRNQFTYNSAAMLLIDFTDDTIIDCNVAAVNYYGYPRDRFLTMRITDINTLPASEVQLAMASVSSKHGKQFEFQHRLSDGSIRDVEESISCIQFGERTILHSIIHDITERKHANEALKTALKEKNILLREIHHRVKNNMQVISSMLNLQLGKSENDQFRQALLESQQRISAMSIIHETLYKSNNFNAIDLSLYLDGLVHHLQEVFSNRTDIRLVIKADKIELDIDQAVPCGLILNELITNAFKHAFPERTNGKIQITVYKEEREVVLEISDNGVGLKAGLYHENPTSLGMRLVQGLLRHQLKGRLEISSEGGGTTFTLRWPLSDRKGETV